MSELKEKLESEIIACKWVDIAEFLPKADVLMVDADLDLVEVGVAFAGDHVESVKQWLDEKKIVKIDPDEPENFPRFSHDANFKLLVVTPFALTQKIK